MTENTAIRLRKAMDIRNMKQIELSEKTKIGKSAISQYLSGKVVPKQDKIYLMAQVLNVNEGWLMGYDVPMEKENHIQLTKKDKKEIDDYIDEMRTELLQSSTLLFDGQPAEEEDIEAILNAMKIGAELVKKKNKEKYIPKKYKKG